MIGEVEELKRELKAARKVISVLTRRVEEDINLSGKQYSVFDDFAQLQRQLEEHVRSQQELHSLAVTLEDLVARRTRELEEANQKLNQTNHELQELVRKDGMTGLFNHATSLEIIDEKVRESGRYGHPLSLILLDIDFFKAINDSYGHLFGDHVLKTVARLLQDSIREVDIAGRYGGEEFVILLPNTPQHGAVVRAENIRKKIERLRWEHKSCRVTISAGVCQYAGGDAESLIAKADKLLYMAKDSGRNQVASVAGSAISSNL